MSTASSATRPWPREISSSPSSLLPRPDSPVSSTPRPRMSMNTPWRVVRSAKCWLRYARTTSITWPADSVGDEQRDLGAVAHRDQAVGRRLRVGDDQHRRLQRRRCARCAAPGRPAGNPTGRPPRAGRRSAPGTGGCSSGSRPGRPASARRASRLRRSGARGGRGRRSTPSAAPGGALRTAPRR